MSIVTGSRAVLSALSKNSAGVPTDAEGALSLLVVDPTGGEEEYGGGEITRDGPGAYHRDILVPISGLWHYRWLIDGQAADEGTFVGASVFDSEFTEPEAVDLRDLCVLVPRARRKVEGPWGNANGRPPLDDTQIYEMVADACGEIVMLGGKLFGHTLEVAARDPLGGYPTVWRTDTPLEEYEAAIICAQVALDYYFHVFNNMKIKEETMNEGTSWAYELSAGVIKEYLKGLINERDKAIVGLRINRPVMDRLASITRVRDQATVAVLEWWDIYSPGINGGGLGGGQEASVIPAFHP
jgi:hypothetical protein